MPCAIVANVNIRVGIEISKNFETVSIVSIFRVAMPKMINLTRYMADLTGYRLMKWYSPLQIALGSGFVRE